MIRALSALFLTLALTLTSVTAAVARSEMAGAVEMVICAEGAEGTVSLDPTGKPVAGHHHCPLCTAAPAALEAGAVAGAERPVTRGKAQVCALPLDAVGAAGVVPTARGPPPAM